MSRFLRGELAAMEAYTPGEQLSDREYIKLNTNESPYPPTPEAARLITSGEIERLRLYPEPEGGALKAAIAEMYGLESDNVVLTNGSDEALLYFFMAFCGGGGKVAFPDITYGFYEVFAELYGADYVKIPLGEDFTVNCEDYYGICRNIVIANPNAPTGLSVSVESIEKMLKTNPDNIVLIDEAYVDFGGSSCVELIKKYDNLLVVQTFSKSRSLAGARLGFAVGCREIIDDMNKMKFSTNPYNVNRLTQLAGLAAIRDRAYFEKCTAEIIETRERTAAELKLRGFEVLDSKTNFLFAASGEIGGEDYYQSLKKRGILVRHFGSERIKNYVRITVGTPEQMEKFIKTTDEILKEVRS